MSSIDIENITFLTVNYNTPDLLDRLLLSIRFHYKQTKILIIDGSDDIELRIKAKQVSNSYDNVEIIQLGYNINHGPGLNYGFDNCNTKWVFTVDSDLYFTETPGCVEYMCSFANGENVDNILAISEKIPVTSDGIRLESSNFFPPREIICIWNRDNFYKTPGFIAHGYPTIKIGHWLYSQNELKVMYVDNQKLEKYHVHNFRGTVKRYGYNNYGKNK